MAAAARKGKCRYGKKCRDIRKCSFEHECFFARTEAGCRYGDDCLLLHPTAQNAYRFEKGEEFLFDANKTGLLACAADDSELLAPGFDINEATPEQLSALQRRLDARFQIAIKAIEAAHRVALCFVLDTTGSMKDQIRGVKDQILDIAMTLKAEGCDLRSLAFVGYKDWSDGDDHFEVLDFTPEIDKFAAFVSHISASGGGDIPEDVLGGLLRVRDLHWPDECDCRVVFHLGDAPPHGSQYFTGLDEYPEGHEKDPPLDELFAGFAAKNITYFFGQLNDSGLCNAMKKLFSDAARRDVGELTFDVKKIESITNSVVAATRKTATERTEHARAPRRKPVLVRPDDISLSGDGGRGTGLTYAHEGGPDVPRRLVLDPTPMSPEALQRLLELAGHMVDMELPKDFAFLGLGRTLQLTKKRTSIRVAPDPFAEGSIRYAYHGRLLFRKGGSMTESPTEEDVVLKEYKTLATSPQADLSRFIMDLETQTVAQMVALAFNKRLAEALGREPPFKVSYLKTHIVTFQQSGRSAKRIMSIEKLFREGMTLVKYTNNFNAVNWDAHGVPRPLDSAAWRIKVELMVALSHFSWDFTENQLLLADLQGVDAPPMDAESPPRIVLTDPALHSVGAHNRFGLTNLRARGITGFFSTHKCNQFCRALKLKYAIPAM